MPSWAQFSIAPPLDLAKCLYLGMSMPGSHASTDKLLRANMRLWPVAVFAEPNLDAARCSVLRKRAQHRSYRSAVANRSSVRAVLRPVVVTDPRSLSRVKVRWC